METTIDSQAEPQPASQEIIDSTGDAGSILKKKRPNIYLWGCVLLLVAAAALFLFSEMTTPVFVPSNTVQPGANVLDLNGYLTGEAGSYVMPQMFSNDTLKGWLALGATLFLLGYITYRQFR